jgi:ABC-type multidrug transport system ATPase subunit
MIRFNNVSKYYGQYAAVQHVNININPGELFGLIGPDGSGKTSLFRMLTTLILPDDGEILFDGKDVVKHYRYVRNNVGYMPGTFSLYHDLTVEENLNFFATLYGTTIAENYDLVKDIYIQIEPYKKRKAGALSGGMKQKLALSCALIHKPVVLVLDEPTTGVDAVSRKEFWEMLKRLKEGGLTIIVSTAYMDEATLCDRIALIQSGKIMGIDRPDTIIENFAKPLFAVSGGDTYKMLRLLRSIPEVVMVQPFGDTIHVTLQKGRQPSLLETALDAGAIKGFRIDRIKPNIEDCFMDLMMHLDGE